MCYQSHHRQPATVSAFGTQLPGHALVWLNMTPVSANLPLLAVNIIIDGELCVSLRMLHCCDELLKAGTSYCVSYSVCCRLIEMIGDMHFAMMDVFAAPACMYDTLLLGSRVPQRVAFSASLGRCLWLCDMCEQASTCVGRAYVRHAYVQQFIMHISTM
jgi:hypothetical protein